MTTAYMRILPNYVMTYGPMIAVMVANPILYYQASREVDRQLLARFSQMSNTERDLMTKFKLKFSLINLVFYICWLPNLVNGIVLWTMWYSLPFPMVITVWYIMVGRSRFQCTIEEELLRAATYPFAGHHEPSAGVFQLARLPEMELSVAVAASGEH